MDTQTFTDQQVTTACGMHQDNLRRLITWKAVIPVQARGGRGRVRLWSMEHARRISIISTLFNAGFSLRLAHTIAYCLPFEQRLNTYEPYILFAGDGDLRGWYVPENAAVQVESDDFLVEVINTKFVFYRGRGRIVLLDDDEEDFDCFGRLNDSRTRFIGPVDLRAWKKRLDADPDWLAQLPEDSPYRREQFAKWVDPLEPVDQIDPNSLAYEYDNSFSEDQAKDALDRPFCCQIMIFGLSVRIAMRRLLNLPVTYPDLPG